MNRISPFIRFIPFIVLFAGIISLNPSEGFYYRNLNDYPFNRQQELQINFEFGIYPFKNKPKLKYPNFSAGYRYIYIRDYYQPGARVGSSLIGIIPFRVGYKIFFGKRDILYIQPSIISGIGLYGKEFDFNTYQIIGGLDSFSFGICDLGLRAGIAF